MGGVTYKGEVGGGLNDQGVQDSNHYFFLTGNLGGPALFITYLKIVHT